MPPQLIHLDISEVRQHYYRYRGNINSAVSEQMLSFHICSLVRRDNVTQRHLVIVLKTFTDLRGAIVTSIKIGAWRIS